MTLQVVSNLENRIETADHDLSFHFIKNTSTELWQMTRGERWENPSLDISSLFQF